MKHLLLCLCLWLPLAAQAQEDLMWEDLIQVDIRPVFDPVHKEKTYDISEINPDGTVVKFERYSYEWNFHYRQALNREPPMRPESREIYRILVKLFKKQLKSKKVNHGNHK